MIRLDRPRILAAFLAVLSTWIAGTCSAALIDRRMDASGMRHALLQSESGFAYSHSSAEAIREALTQATSLFMAAIPKALQRAPGSGRT